MGKIRTNRKMIQKILILRTNKMIRKRLRKKMNNQKSNKKTLKKIRAKKKKNLKRSVLQRPEKQKET